jgi:hypothetical protein
MKKFLIERNLPGAGSLSDEELESMAKTSNEVIAQLGCSYLWVQSFITEDKIYCIHMANDEEIIREHAKRSRFPINTISEIKAVISPKTANPSNA